MTTEDKIIIVKGKNRTLQIKSFEDLDNGKIKIVYKDDKEYTYNSSNILIFDDNITLVMNYLKEISLYVKDMQKFFEGVFSRFLKVDEESVLFHYLQSQPLNKLSDKLNLIFPFGCNLSQRDAVKKAFLNNISVIEGPPGTGKTQTILNIIANIVLLTDILARSQYNMYYFTEQVYLFNILNSQDMLNEEEKKYVKNRASVDFVVYRRIDKSVVLAIEVDGFAFHENNPKQKEHDKKKDLILSKYGIKLLRLPTNGSKEEDKILHALDDINIYMN